MTQQSGQIGRNPVQVRAQRTERTRIQEAVLNQARMEIRSNQRTIWAHKQALAHQHLRPLPHHRAIFQAVAHRRVHMPMN